MNILLINQFFYPDSAATSQFLTDLARSLAAEGNSVRVICGRSSYAELDCSDPPEVEIVRTPDVRFARGALARVLSYASFLVGSVFHGFFGPKADLVLTLSTPPGLSLVGSLLKAALGAGHFIWEMDVYPDIAVALNVLRQNSLLTRILGASFDWSRRRADGIIALGEDMRNRLEARNIPREKIHVAENWADGREIRPRPFPKGPLTIHYSGNLGLAHETETILAVIERLRNHPDFRFIFAGGGSHRPRLEAFCRTHAIGNVEFRPYCPRTDLGRSLGESHLGLVTQLPQSLGSVVPSKIYGVMASGRPLLYIGPDKSTPAEHIRRLHCGWRIQPGDAETLVALLHRLNGNRSLLVQTGARARRAFEDSFDRAIAVNRVLEILDAGWVADLSPVNRGLPAVVTDV